MAKDLNSIQILARFYAREETLDITTANSVGLGIFNEIYRKLAAKFKFSEFWKSSTQRVTVAGTASYTWPDDLVFTDVTSIEIQDPSNSNRYAIVPPAKYDGEFTQYEGEADSFPLVYRRYNDGSNKAIQFSPAPNTSNLNIRINGLTEPVALAQGGDTTEFLSSGVDDALHYLAAAKFLRKNEQKELALDNVAEAADILSSIVGREISPSEIDTGVRNG